MTRSRSFHRFHRWTAKLRRRALRQALPEPREGELQAIHPKQQVRCQEWQRDQLNDLLEPESLEAAS